MGIPRKFTTRGYSVIPLTFCLLRQIHLSEYVLVLRPTGHESRHAFKDEDNIFVTYISNFSCAPDSFMLHYLKWIMGTKPFLILEIDSHTADAGVDTRIEAFLDIIEGYRSKITGYAEKDTTMVCASSITGEEIHIKNASPAKRYD